MKGGVLVLPCRIPLTPEEYVTERSYDGNEGNTLTATKNECSTLTPMLRASTVTLVLFDRRSYRLMPKSVANSQICLPLFGNIPDDVVADAVGFAQIGFKHIELFSVIYIQPVPSAKPHQALRILEDCADRASKLTAPSLLLVRVSMS